MPGFSVGLDARMWDHPGIGRYLRELSYELLEGASNEAISLIGNSRLIKNSFPVLKNPDARLSCVEADSKIYSVHEQWEMPWKAWQFDLLHVPHFNIPVFSKNKMVVTVHDLIYLHEPRASRSRFGRAYAGRLLKIIAKKAAAVIAVSDSTKKDLLDHFPELSSDRIFVTHEAPSALFKKIDDASELSAVKRRYGLEKPFILFIGTFKPHKNIPTLIRALKVLREGRAVDHELILVGRKDERNTELIRLIGENQFVRCLGELSNREIAVLYNLAEVFVLPSYYEGFGLPVIEAMACGTPVIASNRTSLPEVVGGAGLLFDPERVDALTELLYNAISDQELRKNLSKLGLERAKTFTWRRAAEKTLQVYRQVMN